jgi:flagellar assembly protein FliH
MSLAFARGYEAGRRESEGVAIADVEPVLRALQRAAERIELAESVFERDRAQVVTVLSLAVARHLMLAEVKGDPDYVTRLVTRALEQVSQDAPIEVRLHPEDLRATEAAGGVAPGGTPAIKWTGDPTLSRGDCIVESPTRLVDGRIDRALLRLVERLSHE